MVTPLLDLRGPEVGHPPRRGGLLGRPHRTPLSAGRGVWPGPAGAGPRPPGPSPPADTGLKVAIHRHLRLRLREGAFRPASPPPRRPRSSSVFQGQGRDGPGSSPSPGHGPHASCLAGLLRAQPLSSFGRPHTRPLGPGRGVGTRAAVGASTGLERAGVAGGHGGGSGGPVLSPSPASLSLTSCGGRGQAVLRTVPSHQEGAPSPFPKGCQCSPEGQWRLRGRPLGDPGTQGRLAVTPPARSSPPSPHHVTWGHQGTLARHPSIDSPRCCWPICQARDNDRAHLPRDRWPSDLSPDCPRVTAAWTQLAACGEPAQAASGAGAPGDRESSPPCSHPCPQPWPGTYRGSRRSWGAGQARESRGSLEGGV